MALSNLIVTRIRLSASRTNSSRIEQAPEFYVLVGKRSIDDGSDARDWLSFPTTYLFPAPGIVIASNVKQ